MKGFGQLALNVHLNVDATFENFFCANSDPHKLAIRTIKAKESKFLHLFGPKGSGISHLLQAVCNDLSIRKELVAYLPLSQLFQKNPVEVLDGIHEFNSICIDDIDMVTEFEDWQVEIFNLVNRIKDSGARLIVGSHRSIDYMNLSLEDLESRLKSFLGICIPKLQDSELIGLIYHQASIKGLKCSEGVAEFIIKRVDRSTHEIMAILRKLDKRSLEDARIITIPFVKQVLQI